MLDLEVSFTAELWRWQGEGTTWHGMTLPKKEAEKIKLFVAETKGKKRRGFGSVRVQVKVGKTAWKTSVFPDSKSGSYVLFIKAAVRKQEDLKIGDSIKTHLTILP